MKRTIAAFWHGELAEIGCLSYSNFMIQDIEQLMRKERARLRETLTGNEAEMFATYAECADDRTKLTAEQAFCSGFSLAVRLLTEAMQEE